MATISMPAAGGLEYFEESTSGSTIYLGVIPNETNASVSVAPNGTGSFFLGSDNYTRGQSAVDLQILKNQNYQVAEGNYSTLLGGSYNRVTGEAGSVVGGSRGTSAGLNSSVIGGYFCTANNEDSGTLAGSYNQCNGDNSVVLGGSSCRAEDQECVVAGGQSNRAYNQGCAILAGSNNETYGFKSGILAGFRNRTTGNFSAAVGRYAESFNDSEFAIGAGTFSGSTPGQAQYSKVVIEGSASTYLPTDGCLWLADGKVLSRDDTGLFKAWEFTAIANNTSGSMAINIVKPITELGTSGLDWTLTVNPVNPNRFFTLVRSPSNLSLNVEWLTVLDVAQVK